MFNKTQDLFSQRCQLFLEKMLALSFGICRHKHFILSTSLKIYLFSKMLAGFYKFYFTN